jgi:hypothetical protein
MFDEGLRSMMDKLNNELLIDAQTPSQKSRAAILAKRDLLSLLVRTSLEYCEETDSSIAFVIGEIIKQYDSMID